MMPATTCQRKSPSAPPGSPMRAGLLAASIAAAVLLPLIAWGVAPSRVAFDAMLYHSEAIRTFASQWPDCNVLDYLSATTPGYHLLSAAISQLFGTTHGVLAFAGSFWTLLLVFTLASACAARARGVLAGAALALAVFASVYVHWAGAATLPDSAGWLLVVLQMLLAMRIARSRETSAVLWLAALFGACFLACVLVRQSHAWTAGLLLGAAWLAPGTHDGARSRARAFLVPSKQRIARLALALWALVPGIAALALFVRLWGGLVPPRFATQYPPKGLLESATSPAWVFVLTATGLFSPFFAGFALPGVQAWWREQRVLLLSLLGVAAVLMCVPATTYSFEAGRWSGLWNIAQRLPSVGHVSVFMVALACCGLLLLLGLLRSASREARWVLGLSLLGFACAFAASNELWQRYVEPLVLIVLVLAAAEAWGCRASTTELRLAGEKPPSRLSQLLLASRWPGVAALAVAMIALSVALTLRTGQDMRGEKPPTRSPVHRGPTPPVELPPVPRDGRTLWSPLAR
jgi:hypothetical protein